MATADDSMSWLQRTLMLFDHESCSRSFSASGLRPLLISIVLLGSIPILLDAVIQNAVSAPNLPNLFWAGMVGMLLFGLVSAVSALLFIGWAVMLYVLIRVRASCSFGEVIGVVGSASGLIVFAASLDIVAGALPGPLHYLRYGSFLLLAYFAYVHLTGLQIVCGLSRRTAIQVVIIASILPAAVLLDALLGLGIMHTIEDSLLTQMRNVFQERYLQ